MSAKVFRPCTQAKRYMSRHDLTVHALFARANKLAWAVGLHFGFLALFLMAMPKLMEGPSGEVSAIVYLPPKSEPLPVDMPAGESRNGSHWYKVPDMVWAMPRTDKAEGQGRQALAQALFSCAPENWDKLSEEARAACAKRQGFAYDPHRLLLSPPPPVRHAEIWRRAQKDKTAPTRVPGGLFGVVRSVMDGSILDPESAIRNPQKWPHAEDRKIGNAEAQVQQRNTTDICAAAKAGPGECINSVVYGKTPP